MNKDRKKEENSRGWLSCLSFYSNKLQMKLTKMGKKEQNSTNSLNFLAFHILSVLLLLSFLALFFLPLLGHAYAIQFCLLYCLNLCMFFFYIPKEFRGEIG